MLNLLGEIITLGCFGFMWLKVSYLEIKDIISNKKFIDHYDNFWNVIDSIVIVFGLLYIVLEILLMLGYFSPSNIWIRLFFSSFNFLLFLKLISFLRGFTETAFLIRTIIVVAGDILYFLFILVIFIAMIAFSSIIFIILQNFKKIIYFLIKNNLLISFSYLFK